MWLVGATLRPLSDDIYKDLVESCADLRMVLAVELSMLHEGECVSEVEISSV